MSIVVGVEKDGQVVLAADGQSNFGNKIVPPDNHVSRKIRRVGGALLGRTGWGLYDNILEDFIAKPEPPDLGNAEAIFRFFTELWKALHKRYSFVNDQSGRKDSPFGDLGASFLVANRGGIFYVSPNMGVTPFRRYYAIGSGSDYALGALYQVYDREPDATTVARRAVETACALNVHCGGAVEVATID